MGKLGRLALGVVFMLGGAACGSGGAAGDDGGVDAPVIDAAVDAAVIDAAVDAAVDGGSPDGATLCGLDDPVVAEGSHHPYVLDALLLPTTATQAYQFGVDLDGDPQSRPDNAIGQILSVLANQSDIDFQAANDVAVARGEIITLADVQTTSLTTATSVGIAIAHGDDPSPDPCLNSGDTVCGQHLQGDGSFGVAAHPAPARLGGQIVAEQATAGPGIATLRAVLFGIGAPVALKLYGARVQVGQVTELGLVEGKLGGGIAEADFYGQVLPTLHADIAAAIAVDCTGEPIGCPGADCRPCGCAEGALARTLLDLFDEYTTPGDNTPDCQVELQELLDNSLISNLLQPDIDLFDCAGGAWPDGCCYAPRVDGVKDSISVGIGFTGVGATFTLP